MIYQKIIPNLVLDNPKLFRKNGGNVEFTLTASILRDWNSIKDSILNSLECISNKIVHAPICIDERNDIEADIGDASDIGEKSFELFTKAIKKTPILDSRKVVIHLGIKNMTYSRLNIAIWRIKRLLETADEHNITLVFENVFEKDSSFWKLLESIFKNRFELCFDSGHFNVYSKTTIEEFLKGINNLRLLHLSDNYGENDEHNALGNGIFNFDRLFSLVPNNIDITLEMNNKRDLEDSVIFLKKRGIKLC